MKREQIFHSESAGTLLVRFARHPRSRLLRDELMAKIDPLIDAAISKKRLFDYRDDLHQECAIKVLAALPKFDPDRGNAFAFLWTVICNQCNTHAKKLSRTHPSLSDDTVLREAEVVTPPHFQNPERSHILNVLAGILKDSFEKNALRQFTEDKERKAIEVVLLSVQSGDLFQDRMLVVKQIRAIGIRKRDVDFYIDYTMVTLRARLYTRRDVSAALLTRPVGEASSAPEMFE